MKWTYQVYRNWHYPSSHFAATLLTSIDWLIKENLMRLFPLVFIAAACSAQRFDPVIPKTWDEVALRTMEVPLATPGASPVHISAERYYAIPPLTPGGHRVFPRATDINTDEGKT